MTAQQLIATSLTLAGQMGPGRGAGSSESAVALEALNAMLDAWNTQRLAVYAIRSAEYPLVGGQQTYTIGPGGDFDAARPVRIELANLVILSNPASPLHRPLEPASSADWAAIRLPGLESTLPTRYYYEPAHPLGKLHLWPAPTESNRVEIYTWQPLGRITSLDDTFDLPPGYEEAVKYNLAVRLSTMFLHAQRRPSPLVLEMARESLAAIKRLNAPAPVMGTEPVMGGTPAGFDYRLGE